MHTTFCMGASIGTATGFNRAGEDNVVAVIGDSTFLHGGLPALASAVYNQVPTTMILLDNRTTGMTGHQDHAGTGHTLKGEPAPAVDYEALVRALGVEHVEVTDPWDLEATEGAIRAGMAHPGPAVVIVRHECMLLPDEKAREHAHFFIDTDGCIRCEECLETGCPALVWDHDKDRPFIREWECNGCSVCAQVCPTETIGPMESQS
jgi:indolepyruvate ferredoxin oxidoreductase alpha subunit